MIFCLVVITNKKEKMKISQKMQDAINDQIKNEFDNAFLYLSIASWFEENDLQGFAQWNFVQYQEEQTHGIKFYKYVIERQGRVIIKQIDKPVNDWASPLAVFEDILAREQQTTKAIYSLYKTAQEENDYTSLGFLKWYLDEQVEEENNATEILNRLKMIGDSKSAMLLLDRELSKRVFVDETK